MPLSAFAESFTVISNKDIYTLEDKAIIVGTVPADAPHDYAVLVKVTGPKGDCATQNILPGADNSFVYRSIRLDKCGLGEVTVSAFYADQKATSTFTISNGSHADAGSKMELRMLKNIVLQAQETVSSRVKELVEGGHLLPGEVAQEYSQGVSEASLALGAIDFGDAAEAKYHMIFAFRDFRGVLDALSGESMARRGQTASNNNSEIIASYDMVQKYYYRLQELAEKNHVDKKSEFAAVALLLSNSVRMMDGNNYEGAKQNLDRVNAILEDIRAGLFDRREEGSLAPDGNSTSHGDGELARKLTDFAARYENKALELLNETGSNHKAEAKVQGALSLIASARTSIEAHDLESARSALSAAYVAINEANDLIEHDKGENGNTSTSSGGENSQGDSEESSNDHSKDPANSGSGKNDSDAAGQ